MEIFETHKFFAILSLLLLPGDASSPPGTIERSTKQQLVLASLSPSHETAPTYGSPHLFLTSPPLQKYSASLVRVETTIAGGSQNHDFCYIRIEETGGQSSVWESECTSVSNLNTCTLVFSYTGLEIYDGSHLSWDTGADDDYLRSLDLVDGGDMEIRDKDGKLVWKASDNPFTNQNCGNSEASIGKEKPPFGGSLGNQAQQSLNQPLSSPNQPSSGFNQPFGSASNNNKPFGADNQQGLVGNIPFASGVLGEKKVSIGITLVSLVTLI